MPRLDIHDRRRGAAAVPTAGAGPDRATPTNRRTPAQPTSPATPGPDERATAESVREHSCLPATPTP
jgi:hypothetical protein